MKNLFLKKKIDTYQQKSFSKVYLQAHISNLQDWLPLFW